MSPLGLCTGIDPATCRPDSGPAISLVLVEFDSSLVQSTYPRISATTTSGVSGSGYRPHGKPATHVFAGGGRQPRNSIVVLPVRGRGAARASS